MRENNGQAGAQHNEQLDREMSDEVGGRVARSLGLRDLAMELRQQGELQIVDDDLFRAIWSAPGRLLVYDKTKQPK